MRQDGHHLSGGAHLNSLDKFSEISVWCVVMNTHDPGSKGDRFSEQDDYVSLLILLREEFQNLKTQNGQQELRLARLEDTLNALAQDLKKLATLGMSKLQDEHVAGHFKRTSPCGEPVPPQNFTNEAQGSWEYVAAQKGGYNHVLYTTIRDLFALPEDPVQFLTFLVQKRDTEIKQQLEQLQAEYKKLKGSQLQEHFRELWKSHYTLLKKKQGRTWKEEIFLEAFDALLAWLQD
jgi:DNA-binding transcriptional regulator GbsR (MarR family)